MSLNKIIPSNGWFDSLLRGFNQRWAANDCEIIYLPTTTADVATALAEVVEQYDPGQLSVRSGGHCYENFVCRDGIKAIVDLRLMNGTEWMPSRNAFVVEPGAGNWDGAKTLNSAFGKAIPGGSCYSVAAGGHIMGGGYGLLSRLHGLTIDWLTGVEVVWIDSNGVVQTTYMTGSANDLVWACSGGGGSFGIVTGYYFASLPDSPRLADITVVGVNWSDITCSSMFAQIVALYGQYCSTWDNRVFGLGKFNHHSAPQIAFLIQSVSDNPAAADALLTQQVQPFVDALKQIVPVGPVTMALSGHPVNGYIQSLPGAVTVSEFTQRLPWIDATQTLNGSGENQRGKYKSAYLKTAMPSDQVSALYTSLTTDPGPTPSGLTIDMTSSLVQIDSYGGIINNRSRTASAVPQRSSIMKLQYQTYWKHYVQDCCAASERDDAHLTWIRDLYTNVYAATGGTPTPNTNNDGCYFNYPDVDLGTGANLETALELYFAENLPRLKSVKNVYDPLNWFQFDQSIPL